MSRLALGSRSQSQQADRHLEGLLRLLDFSSLMSGDEAFERGLEATLYSLMGELAALSAVLLVRDGEAQGYRVAIAKGRSAASLMGRRLRIQEQQLLTAGERTRAPGWLDEQRELGELADALGIELLAPLSHAGSLTGVLGLGASARGAYGEAQRALVSRVASIAGTVVANHELVEQLERVNRRLQVRVHQLNTVFEVSYELNRSLDEGSVFRILTTTIMGQVLVGQAAVLVQRDGMVVPAATRGLELSQREREQLAELPFEQLRERLEAGQDPPAPLPEIASRAGLVEMIPVGVGDSVEALVMLGRRFDGRLLGDEERGFVATLGAQALVALDNLRLHLEMVEKQRMERELSIAREIQRGLLPPTAPCLEGWEIVATTEPSYEVGGDYYDFFEGESRLGLALGDVVGKSVPAALLMASVSAALRALSNGPPQPPPKLMATLNDQVAASVRPGRFVSLIYGQLDPVDGELSYVNAGHNPPYLVHRDGSVERLDKGGVVLGVLPGSSYELGRCQLEPGELLALYSDGVSEAMDPDDQEFGEQRLEQLVQAGRGQPVGQLLQRVLAELAEHRAGRRASDDTTLMLIRRL